MLRFPPRPTALILSASLAACAAGSSTTGTFGSGGSGASGESGGAASTSSSSSGTGAGNVGGGFTSSSSGGTGGAAPVDFAVYAHSGKTLFTIDPKAPGAAPKSVGDFDCIGTSPDTAMLDIALNEAGDLWGISYQNLYKLTIQGSVVHCATTIALPAGSATYFGLTFAPKGVLGAAETLIASNTAGELWKVDTTNGKLEQHGTFGTVPANDGHGNTYANKGKKWELSGDIVFLANGGNPVGFATVRDCPNPPATTNCDLTDTLIEIDMSQIKAVGAQSVTFKVRGQVQKTNGCPGTAAEYEQMLGIAAWDDKVYGFSHKGSIVEINNTDGSACQVASTPTVFWNGAGVTTLAPVIKPPT
jgi:hypothetical protein